MKQVFLGALLGLIFASVGFFWWQGRAQVENNAPPPPEAEPVAQLTDEIPASDPGDLTGPEPPEASELTREQRRFFRYDRNRDWRISRNEMLSTRSNAFRRLDVDGNNLLTFEEWAVTTSERFDTMDADGDAELTPAEFATSAPRRTTSRSQSCRC